MDASEAIRFLHPRVFCIATSVAAASAGELGRGACPTLYSFVALEANVPSPRNVPRQATYAQLLESLRLIRFHPYDNDEYGLLSQISDQLQTSLSSSNTQTQMSLAHFVACIIETATACPDSLALLNDLIVPQLAQPNSAYEPDSLLSSFLRKTFVAFHSLTFEVLTRLLRDLRHYIDGSSPTSLPTPISVSCQHDEFVSRPEAPTPATLSSAVTDLANGPSLQRLSSTLPPPLMSPPYITPFSQTVSPNPLPPRSDPLHVPEPPDALISTTSEYVWHLEALRRKDVSFSLETLHRYFDRALYFLPRPSFQTDSSSLPFSDTSTSPTQQQQQQNQIASSASDPHTHQYVALSLAIAHARLGCRDLASASLDDTVRAAHASADSICHMRTLSWIAHVEVSPTRRHLLLAHAGDPLALAREHVVSVFTPLSDAVPHAMSPLTTLARVSHEIGSNASQHSNSSVQRMRSVLPAVVPIAERRVSKLLVGAAAWSSFGDDASALACAKLALSVATAESSGCVSTDRVEAACSVASLLALTQGDYSAALALLDATSAEARTSCMNINERIGNQSGEETKGNDANQNGEALNNLAPEIDALARTTAWISFGHAERSGNAREAECALRRFEAAVSSAGISAATGGDLDRDGNSDACLDVWEARTRLALLVLDLRCAVRSAYELCRRAARAVRPIRAIEALTFAAQAFLTAHACPNALHAALAAVSLADGLGLEAARIRAVCTMAACMAEINCKGRLTKVICRGPDGDGADMALRATQVMDDILPIGMNGCGSGNSTSGYTGNETRANILRVRAECALALAATRGLLPDDYIISLLRRALNEYTACKHPLGSKRCWYLLARVHDLRGEVVLRNSAARRFTVGALKLAQLEKVDKDKLE